MEDGSLFEPEMVMPFRADVMRCTYALIRRYALHLYRESEAQGDQHWRRTMIPQRRSVARGAVGVVRPLNRGQNANLCSRRVTSHVAEVAATLCRFLAIQSLMALPVAGRDLRALTPT
jgi:hypothetical protein